MPGSKEAKRPIACAIELLSVWPTWFHIDRSSNFFAQFFPRRRAKD
jgi:hypothetical protein